MSPVGTWIGDHFHVSTGITSKVYHFHFKGLLFSGFSLHSTPPITKSPLTKNWL